VFGDGDVEPAFGIQGGKEGTLNSIVLHDPGGETRTPLPLDLIPGVPKGTVYQQHAGGGGGFGNPMKRPRALVAEEVKSGIVSVAAAREHYGVVLNETDFSIDEKSTDDLRGNSGE